MRQDPLEGDLVDDGEPAITSAQVFGAQRNLKPARTLPPALREHMWKPGQSGNPLGTSRTPGLARRVREAIGDDPTELVNVLLEIALNHREKSIDRIAAVDKLLDRGYGKAPSHAPVEGGDPLEQNELDKAINEIAAQLVKRSHPTLDAEVVVANGGSGAAAS